jgi:ribosomal protein S18 acetylase RimI-like enzyme
MPERIVNDSLKMIWIRAPWDEVVCKFPVIQIDHIEVTGSNAMAGMRLFAEERDRIGARLVSCRLPNQCMVESMLLEACDFRFVEMSYSPDLDLAKLDATDADSGLTVTPAVEADLPALLAVAGVSFTHERFKVDHRLDPAISDARYQNWVATTLLHPTQELFVITDAGKLVAFFVTESLPDGTCYWHLNAVAPEMQGQGYGRRVWSSMLRKAQRDGARRVRTSVVARNDRVLNLYARLGFSFSQPKMTFHWVKPAATCSD